MITPVGVPSFKGVYYTNMDKRKATNADKIGLILLAEEINNTPGLKDYDFIFGNIEQLRSRRIAPIDIELDGEKMGAAILTIGQGFKTIKTNISNLQERVYGIKEKLFQKQRYIKLEDQE